MQFFIETYFTLIDPKRSRIFQHLYATNVNDKQTKISSLRCVSSDVEDTKHKSMSAKWIKSYLIARKKRLGKVLRNSHGTGAGGPGMRELKLKSETTEKTWLRNLFVRALFLLKTWFRRRNWQTARNVPETGQWLPCCLSFHAGQIFIIARLYCVTEKSHQQRSSKWKIALNFTCISWSFKRLLLLSQLILL